MSVANNNSKYKIRTAHLDDAKALRDIKREVVRENEYLISVLEEFDENLEQQSNWIQSVLEHNRETLIVAEVEGKVVGWLVFNSPTRKRLSHTGSFGMMIHKDYRGIGIGKKLITELLDWAEKNPLIEKVSLGVFCTNKRAISLYKSMGFIEEGRKIKEIKLKDNEYVDDILMYKLV
ncbi:N-acetyltransferase family protein [Bacillus sp. SCS-153A]|uniref:GNAT family N-acetyltransferase n=1 Tax=Rossellomorea sedimentorum TaxID=3115294 RepID=UPI003906BA34